MINIEENTLYAILCLRIIIKTLCELYFYIICKKLEVKSRKIELNLKKKKYEETTLRQL